MPTRAPRHCTTPACPYTRPCPDHAHSYDTHRPTANRRGYGQRWQHFRKQYLQRHPHCEHCGQPATDVDHIDGEGPNGPRGYDESNLRPLCHRCHSRRTATDQSGWGA